MRLALDGTSGHLNIVQPAKTKKMVHRRGSV